MTTDEDAKRLLLRLSGAHYSQQLAGIHFSGAELASVVTPQFLRLDRCRFVGADLRQATLYGSHFELYDRGASLQGASLRGASFSGCDLTGADLRSADLLDTKFGAVGVGRGSRPTVLTDALVDQGAVDTGPGDGTIE